MKQAKSTVKFHLKMQPFNPQKPEKWGMKMAVPRRDAVMVGTGKSQPRNVASEKFQHKMARKKGKPPKGYRYKEK